MQRHWLYLEEIFSLPEIKKQLEKEAKRFYTTIDSYFRAVVKGFESSIKVHVGVMREVSLPGLAKMIRECEEIGKGLGDFLEFKREKFPRLYFLSNEEIVDIFGMEKLIEASKGGGTGHTPSRTFISNLFEGVESVSFGLAVNEEQRAIVSVTSKEGERLELLRPVFVDKDPPDVWLKTFETQLQQSVKLNTLLATATLRRDTDFSEWISMWPGQCLLTSEWIWLTSRI